MPEQRVVRRLAALPAADVAGYSRLMGEDEEGTHERLLLAQDRDRLVAAAHESWDVNQAL